MSAAVTCCAALVVAALDAATAETALIIQRVLVVADEPGDRLPRRVVDELGALGFDVVVRDDDDVIDVRDHARSLAATVAVELRGARVDLWAELWREDGSAAHASWDAGGDEIAIAAVRIAEVVRAKVLESRGGVHQPARVDALDVVARPAAQNGDAWHVIVAAGPAASIAGNAPGTLGAALQVGALWGDLDVGARATLPLVPWQLEAAGVRAAEVWPVDVALTGAWRVPLGDSAGDVDVSVGGALGARWHHGRVTRATGAVEEGDIVSALAAGNVQLRWRLRDALSVWALLEAGGLLPRPVIVVASTTTTAGPAFAGIAAGLALTLPEEP